VIHPTPRVRIHLNFILRIPPHMWIPDPPKKIQRGHRHQRPKKTEERKEEMKKREVSGLY
jgi:hypothetical protein